LAARDTCESIRRAISSYPWGGLAEGLSVTLTIGIAGSDEGHDAARCLSLADERLYVGKALGRNRIVSGAEGLVAQRDKGLAHLRTAV
jgi:two-component system cell cycle response regulator